MKHFLLNPRFWRNVGFVLFVGLAAVVLFLGFKGFACEYMTAGRTYTAMYEALKTSLLYNVLGGVILCIAVVFYAGTVSDKISLCASIGLGGMASFMLYGGLVLFYGFAAGKILGSLGIFALTGYADMALMVGARSYNCYLWDKKAKKENKTREDLPEYKTRFMAPAV